jgi:hypothetical protein
MVGSRPLPDDEKHAAQLLGIGRTTRNTLIEVGGDLEGSSVSM